MTFDVDIVYDESKGKVLLNDNGTAQGWCKWKVSGMIAKFREKPKLTADHFESLSAHTGSDTSAGGSKSSGRKDDDTKKQIATYRETLTNSEQANYQVGYTLKLKRTPKHVIYESKKDDSVFDHDGRADELEEMNNCGTFADIKLDAVAMDAMLPQGSEQE